MQLQDLRHWQWVLIGLVVGGLMGLIQAQWVRTAEPSGVDHSSRGREVERDLSMPDATTGKYPYYYDLVVRPYEDRQALVGKYMRRLSRPLEVSPPNAKGPQNPKNPKSPKGRSSAVYDPQTTEFLPETAVYVPSLPELAKLMPAEAEVRITVDPEALEQIGGTLSVYGFRETSSPKPTVKIGKIARTQVKPLAKQNGIVSILPTTEADTLLGFLKKVQATHPAWNIRFTYAWWLEPKAQFAIWTLGGLLVIGGIWPFVVNLLSFGRLTHPPRPKKEADLSYVPSVPEAAAAKATLDPAELAAHIQELEKNLEGFVQPGVAPSPQGQAPKPVPAVRKLEAEALKAPKAIKPQAEKPRHYAGEFYPTVAHAPKDEK